MQCHGLRHLFSEHLEKPFYQNVLHCRVNLVLQFGAFLQCSFASYTTPTAVHSGEMLSIPTSNMLLKDLQKQASISRHRVGTDKGGSQSIALYEGCEEEGRTRQERGKIERTIGVPVFARTLGVVYS